MLLLCTHDLMFRLLLQEEGGREEKSSINTPLYHFLLHRSKQFYFRNLINAHPQLTATSAHIQKHNHFCLVSGMTSLHSANCVVCLSSMPKDTSKPMMYFMWHLHWCDIPFFAGLIQPNCTIPLTPQLLAYTTLLAMLQKGMVVLDCFSVSYPVAACLTNLLLQPILF